MGNAMVELASYFKPRAQLLLDRCTACGIPCRIVDTGRTFVEQTHKIAQHRSWTRFSKHEPQLPENLSEAIDICPLEILAENKADWDPKNPLWQRIGAIGRNVGLEWGGDWVEHPDPSHFQWVELTQR